MLGELCMESITLKEIKEENRLIEIAEKFAKLCKETGVSFDDIFLDENITDTIAIAKMRREKCDEHTVLIQYRSIFHTFKTYSGYCINCGGFCCCDITPHVPTKYLIDNVETIDKMEFWGINFDLFDIERYDVDDEHYLIDDQTYEKYFDLAARSVVGEETYNYQKTLN